MISDCGKRKTENGNRYKVQGESPTNTLISQHPNSPTPQHANQLIKQNFRKNYFFCYLCPSSILQEMFGDLMGNMQEKQEAMKAQLAAITIEESAEGLTITANGAGEVLNVSIAPELLTDKEQLEDLMVVTMNKVLDHIAAREAEMSQKMISEMLPPGMEGLFGG
jgi:DNA-binding protein YbaB